MHRSHLTNLRGVVFTGEHAGFNALSINLGLCPLLTMSDHSIVVSQLWYNLANSRAVFNAKVHEYTKDRVFREQPTIKLIYVLITSHFVLTIIYSDVSKTA